MDTGEKYFADEGLILRKPERQDGAAIHALIAACPPLDLNSVYAYLLLCEHHAKTYVIVQHSGATEGAITAYSCRNNPTLYSSGRLR